ncbi:DNA alkylation repair protein [Candidatus Micrarchaeota archaeon]|nr:DNA alkylation repair protein [Candidatus Micrarchaeota archaeon]
MITDEIRKFINKNKNEKARESWLRTIKVHNKVHGVKLSKINPMITKWTKNAEFKDIEELWESGYVEERIIAAKLLSRIGKKNPDKTLKLVKEFSKTLTDWATCDTLATQGIRGIIKRKSDEIIKFAVRCTQSNNLWKKRFGIVLMINHPDNQEAKKIVNTLKNDNEYYVKKAVEWLERKVKR